MSDVQLQGIQKDPKFKHKAMQSAFRVLGFGGCQCLPCMSARVETQG